jgi:hypothetical protein
MTDYLTDAQNDIKTYLEIHHIPVYFYQCLFGELVKVFGVEFLIPDTAYLLQCDDDGNDIPINEDDYSYKDQIEFNIMFLSSTGGWYQAFKAACEECGLMDLYDDYSNMDWVRSDTFDGYIADNMLDVLFSDTEYNDYYKFKTQKEN